MSPLEKTGVVVVIAMGSALSLCILALAVNILYETLKDWRKK